MKLKIIKFNNNLIIPSRAHYNDACFDCYALEDYNLVPMSRELLKMVSEDEYCFTNNTCLIPLGFGLEIPNGYVGIIKPRSSMNKKGVLTLEGIIDSGYTGEIKAGLCNLTNDDIHINKGDRICQIMICPISIVDLVEELGDERGQGGFGSTGK